MQIYVGQTFTQTRVFSQAEFDTFAALSGDNNPIHVDPAFAARTRFGRTAAHGMLLYSALCGLLSAHFPGHAQHTQSFTFTAPTFTDEAMMLQAEVLEVQADRNKILLRTTITNPQGELTCDGETLLGLR